MTEEQLAVREQAMLHWADDVDGIFAFIQYEVIVRHEFGSIEAICAGRCISIRTVVTLWKHRF